MDISLILFYVIGIVAVFAVGVLIYIFSRRFKWVLPPWIFYIWIALSAYIFFAQYLKYQSLHFYVDFSHWAQIIYSITKTGLPNSLNVELLIPGMLNYFSVHFVPLIYLFTIPFKFLPYSETIIVLNGLLMLSSAIPLYKLTVRLGGNKRFGLFMAALFLWYPTFQYITLYEFEMLRFSIPILLWILYFFEARRILLYFLFVLLAILVREEMGLTVAMFGIYAFFCAKRRREGLLAVIAGLAGFLLITSRVMPAFSPDPSYEHIASGAFLPFGVTFTEVLQGVLTHPILALKTVLEPIKIANIFMLVFPLLFVPLGGSIALIGALANVGTVLLSNVQLHSSYMLYYVAPTVPFIFYAFLKAWPKVIARFNAVAVVHAVFVAILFSNIFFGPSPISLQFWFKNIRPAPFRTQDFHWSTYRVTDHHRKVEEFVAMIPDGAIVSAPQFLHPRLYKKKGAMVFPALQSKDGKWQAEYILLDTTNNGLKSESPAYLTLEKMAVVRESDKWELVKADDGYELYRRMEPNGE